jgi:hypothetical protein
MAVSATEASLRTREESASAAVNSRSGRMSNFLPTDRRIRRKAHVLGELMNGTNTYMAVFTGSKSSPRRAAWDSLGDGERRAKEQEGMAAWKAWADKYQGAIVYMGGPLGKTKKVSTAGVADTSNALAAFTVVRADSADAAARMFQNHPHFAIFPGDGVEVMPVLPIPGG